MINFFARDKIIYTFKIGDRVICKNTKRYFYLTKVTKFFGLEHVYLSSKINNVEEDKIISLSSLRHNYSLVKSEINQ
jgi:hypothetical protein